MLSEAQKGESGNACRSILERSQREYAAGRETQIKMAGGVPVATVEFNLKSVKETCQKRPIV